MQIALRIIEEWYIEHCRSTSDLINSNLTGEQYLDLVHNHCFGFKKLELAHLKDFLKIINIIGINFFYINVRIHLTLIITGN